MILERRNRNRATTVAVTMVLVCIAASLFTLTLYPERAWWLSVVIGSASGILIGTPVVLWLLFGLETGFGRRLKRLPLLGYLAVNGIVMTGMLWAGHLAAYHMVWPDSDADFIADPDLPASMFFSISLVVAVSVATELRRLIGPGVFGAVLVGRYRYPRSERRMFLLLDLVGSTGLAERLGPERFLAFLDRWIHGLTEPLLASGGSIYRYIGDEVILTWEWTEDAASRALAFAAAASAAVAEDTAAWQRDFAAVPRMRAALHGGPVIAGEIGDLKREITFLGDTLNTAARIAGEARHHDAFVLASSQALDGIALPDWFVRRDLGPVVLRGKAEPVRLTCIDRAIDERPAQPLSQTA
jgi:adenylate cyclase